MKASRVTSLIHATAAQKSAFRRSLIDWFDHNQRELPWRLERSPYRIWVSEIMLQQTQVATVVDYFRRFIRRFPTVKALAAADQSDVLKMWEGLGYYRRARQMHAAAKQVVDQYDGQFPTAFDNVLALPGIGRYTAGAILSISLDQPHPILEGNTVRLFARLMRLQDDPKTSASQKRLWNFSQTLVPKKRPGDFNQGLMELGSEVCKPKSPECHRCPIIRFCPTFSDGLQDQIPAASKKMKYEDRHEAVVLVSRTDRQQSNKFLVRLCGPNERWSGMWDFPRFEMADKPSERLAQHVKDLSNLNIVLDKQCLRIKHAVTRYRITLDVFKSKSVTGRLSRSKDASLKWVHRNELEKLAMNVSARKIVTQCC